MFEVERKFLLNRPLDEILDGYLHTSRDIEQRYLGDTGSTTVRIRRCVIGETAKHFMTLKQRVTDVTCREREGEISATFYAELAEDCGPAIRKTRHCIEYLGHVWEIDQFHNPELDGLVIAEIELINEGEQFHRPTWLGEEVTHLKQYKNAKLAKKLTS